MISRGASVDASRPTPELFYREPIMKALSAKRSNYK